LELTFLPSSRTATAILKLRAFEFLPEPIRPCWNSSHPREGQIAGQEGFLSPARRISRSSPKPLRLALVALLDEVVDQLARGVIHLHVESFDTPGEVVEQHNGGDGHEQAERSGDQGLGDAARD